MSKVFEVLKKKRIIIAILVLIFFLVLIVFNSNKNEEEQIIEDPIVVNDEVIDNQEDTFNYKEEYDNNHAINDEYIGRLVFSSGLVDQYFCQTSNNSYYLKHSWNKEYFREGSVFLDYHNNFDYDQNRILYGHNVAKSLDETQTHIFTPLHVLEKQDNYERNKELILYLNDRKETYLVCYVYSCKIIEEDGVQYLPEDEPLYDNTGYTEKEFSEYLSKVVERQFYSTGESIELTDRLLTLQTCYENKPDKLIIVCKRINVEYYQ